MPDQPRRPLRLRCAALHFVPDDQARGAPARAADGQSCRCDCLAVCAWNASAVAGREAKLAARALRALFGDGAARRCSFRRLFSKSPVKSSKTAFVRNVLISNRQFYEMPPVPPMPTGLDAAPLVRGAALWALRQLDPARLGGTVGQTPHTSPTSRCWIMDHGVMATLFSFGLGRTAHHRNWRAVRIAGTVTMEKARRQSRARASAAARPSCSRWHRCCTAPGAHRPCSFWCRAMACDPVPAHFARHHRGCAAASMQRGCCSTVGVLRRWRAAP